MAARMKARVLALRSLGNNRSPEGDVATLRGHIDAVTSTGHVVGWARDPASAVSLTVQVRWRGRVVAETIADRFRGDLLELGMGHGHHGFKGQAHPSDS